MSGRTKTILSALAFLVILGLLFKIFMPIIEASGREADYRQMVKQELENRRQHILTECKPTGRQNITTRSKIQTGYTTNGDFAVPRGETIIVKNEYECPDGTTTFLWD